MTDTELSDLNPDRLRAIIVSAVNRLSEEDRAERIKWCRQHDAHGVRLHPSYDDDDIIELRWGNRSLAMVRRDALTGDGPVVGVINAQVPDNAAELDDDRA